MDEKQLDELANELVRDYSNLISLVTKLQSRLAEEDIKYNKFNKLLDAKIKNLNSDMDDILNKKIKDSFEQYATMVSNQILDNIKRETAKIIKDAKDKSNIEIEIIDNNPINNPQKQTIETNVNKIELIDFLKSKGLTVVDKTPNGGCVWVKWEEDKEDIISSAEKQYNVKFRYSSSPKALHKAPGWFFKVICYVLCIAYNINYYS